MVQNSLKMLVPGNSVGGGKLQVPTKNHFNWTPIYFILIGHGGFCKRKRHGPPQWGSRLSRKINDTVPHSGKNDTVPHLRWCGTDIGYRVVFDEIPRNPMQSTENHWRTRITNIHDFPFKNDTVPHSVVPCRVFRKFTLRCTTVSFSWNIQ